MIKYFSHDVFAREDFSLKRLINKWGFEGYGLFWALIEFLHNNENKIDIKEIDIIAFDLRADIEKISSIIYDFDLFQVEDNFISSRRVAENLRLQKEKSEKARESALRRWKPDDNEQEELPAQCERIAMDLPVQCESNAIKRKKKKADKKKEDENKKNEMKKIKEEENKCEASEISADSENFCADSYSMVDMASDTELSATNDDSSTVEGGFSSSPPVKNFFYGSGKNVFLSDEHFSLLQNQALSNALFQTVLEELSVNIARGKEQPYDNRTPASHFLRLQRYIEQKFQLDKAKQASKPEMSKSLSRINSPENQRMLNYVRKLNEEEGVPPPPEFFEAKAKLLEKLKMKNLGGL